MHLLNDYCFALQVVSLARFSSGPPATPECSSPKFSGEKTPKGTSKQHNLKLSQQLQSSGWVLTFAQWGAIKDVSQSQVLHAKNVQNLWNPWPKRNYVVVLWSSLILFVLVFKSGHLSPEPWFGKLVFFVMLFLQFLEHWCQLKMQQCQSNVAGGFWG